jgi:hypothetical protein
MKRITSVLSVFACLAPLMIGCSSTPEDPASGTDDEAVTGVVARGVDYSFTRRAASDLRAAGYTFAARYLAYQPNDKVLLPAEATSLHQGGIGIVLNWEQTDTDPLQGFNTGVAHAREALRQANVLGAPSNRPIYFSVDFDATPGQQAAINSYFDGVISVIGIARTGAYGGYWVIKRLFDAGKIRWGWQTYAWSGGNWDSRAQLRQVQNGVNCDARDTARQCDIDDAMAADFGQWGGSVVSPPPAQTKCTAQEITNATLNGEHFWTCQGTSRYICDDQGNKISQSCGGNCIGEGVGHDDQCPLATACTASEQTNSTLNGAHFWTCEGNARYICDDRGHKASQTCANGCQSAGVGADDQCK